MRKFILIFLSVLLLAGAGLSLYFASQPEQLSRSGLELTDFTPENFLFRLRFQNPDKLLGGLQELLFIRRFNNSRFADFYHQILQPTLKNQSSFLPQQELKELKNYLGPVGAFSIFNSKSKRPGALAVIRLTPHKKQPLSNFDTLLKNLITKFASKLKTTEVRGATVHRLSFHTPYTGMKLTLSLARYNHFFLLSPRFPTIKQTLTKILPATSPPPIESPKGKKNQQFTLDYELRPTILAEYFRSIPELPNLPAKLSQHLRSTRGQFNFQSSYFRLTAQTKFKSPESSNNFLSVPTRFKELKFYSPESIFLTGQKIPAENKKTLVRGLSKFLRPLSNLNNHEKIRKNLSKLLKLTGKRFTLGAKLNLTYFRKYLNSSQRPNTETPLFPMVIFRLTEGKHFVDKFTELVSGLSQVKINRTEQYIRVKTGQRQFKIYWTIYNRYCLLGLNDKQLQLAIERFKNKKDLRSSKRFQRLRKQFPKKINQLSYLSFAPLKELAAFKNHPRLLNSTQYQALKTPLNFNPLTESQQLLQSLPGTLAVSWRDNGQVWRTKVLGSGDFLFPLSAGAVGILLFTFF